MKGRIIYKAQDGLKNFSEEKVWAETKVYPSMPRLRQTSEHSSQPNLLVCDTTKASKSAVGLRGSLAKIWRELGGARRGVSGE